MISLSNKNLRNIGVLSLVSFALLFSACAKKEGIRIKVNKERGIASWYGPGFHGKRTASGEKYDQKQMTAAHKTLPFGTMVKVYNLDNMKSVVVRVNDRGPFTRGRVIDLSKRAAADLDIVRTGTAPVLLFYLPEGVDEFSPPLMGGARGG